MDITASIKPPEERPRRRRRAGFLVRFLGFVFVAGMKSSPGKRKAIP